MGKRTTSRSEFNAAVKAAALALVVPYERFAGADATFNKSASFPLIGSGDVRGINRIVHLEDAEIPSSQLGGYLSSIRFGVFVSVKGTVALGGADAEDEADALLDSLEEVLAGQQLSSRNYIQVLPGPEGVERVTIHEQALTRIYQQVYQIVTC